MTSVSTRAPVAIRYYDGQSAQAYLGVLSPPDESGRVQVLVSDHTYSLNLHQARIRAAIGETPPCLEFADDVCVELVELTFPDWLIPADWTESRSARARRLWLSRIHLWEQSPRWIIAGVLLTGLMVFGLLNDGVPIIARQTAYALPAHTLDDLAVSTLQALDHETLKPSQISLVRQTQIEQEYDTWVADVPAPHLIFRAGGSMGPNAFALPDGRIVVTDELVALIHHDFELMAVLAHETGHVERRHALRQIIANDSIRALLIAITGNTAHVLNDAPTEFIGLTYSREFEREADDFAYQRMTERGIPLHYFSDLLSRLAVPEQHDLKTTLQGYLSTHPAISERLTRFQTAAS